jgi:hypothetical protein
MAEIPVRVLTHQTAKVLARVMRDEDVTDHANELLQREPPAQDFLGARRHVDQCQLTNPGHQPTIAV